MALALFLVLLAIMIAPAGAQAATVSGGEGSFRFEAAPGELNDVKAYAYPQFVRFEDRGGGLTAGAGCKKLGDGTVECGLTGSGLIRVDFSLGDRDDLLDILPLRYGGIPDAHSAIEGGDGNDEIRTHGGSLYPERTELTALGGAGDDRLLGGGVLDGGPGADEITGSGGPQRLEGGDGNDALVGRSGAQVNGGAGNDSMRESLDGYSGGSGAAARFDGDEGDDELSAHYTTVVGGPGDDRIASGNQWAEGGEGNDTMRGNLLRGGPGDDSLTGNETPRIYAGHPAETNELDGGPGNDTLRAGALDTVFIGGTGADTFIPGERQDTLRFWTHDGGVRVDMRPTDGWGTVAGEADRIAPGFERVEGTNFDDEVITASTRSIAVSVYGYAGSDRLVGGDGFDTLDGGPHDDVIAGGGGNDTLFGGADTFQASLTEPKIAAAGNDTIDGGRGDDRIFPRGGDDYVQGGSGDDVIDSRENAGSFGPLGGGTTAINHSHIIQMSGADQVWCGGGGRVDADYADAIASGCEVASEGTPRWRTVKVKRGRPVRLTVRCAWADARPCKGEASLLAVSGESPIVGAAAPDECRHPGGLWLATTRFRVRAGRVNYVRLRLDRDSEREVRRHRCVAGMAVLRFKDAAGRQWEASRSLALRRSGG